MALLTAEDVLNKAFSKTKYREGFDQDEVDDFLDEVANTIAQLTAERDELAAKLSSPAAPAPEPAAANAGLLTAATEPGGVNPTGMLAMAQKLHDEYVQAGEAERDRIIDEAHTAADQIRERADEDAKARMEALSGERADLEARIDDLRRFERDYRARLRTYLENLLGDLDHSGISAATEPAAAPATAPAAAEVAAEPASAPEEAAAEPAAAPAFEDAAAPAPEEAAGEPVAEPAADQKSAAEGEAAPAVSFEEAVGGFTPQAPAYDASQSWESQLRPPNPFEPVTPEASESSESLPVVEQPEETEEAPYTPPSSRMFNELYTQQRPEQEN